MIARAHPTEPGELAGLFVPLRGFLAREGALIFSVCATLALLLGVATPGYSDTWLAIAAGQVITAHGLPHADNLAVWTHGTRWVDQQWLAQIVIAKLFRFGGIRAVAFVCDGMAATAFVVAAAAARRRGASSRTTLWVAMVALAALAPFAGNPRTQSLAYLPFVVLVVLVSRDSRKPSHVILVSLPLLVLWANLHGSVLLGALMVSVHGVLSLRRRPFRNSIPLIVAPWICVFASPYAIHLPAYYVSTIGSPNFARYVQEWQPAHLSPFTVAFYLLAGGALYLSGRCRRQLTPTEAALLVVTGVAGAHAIRNIIWFAYATLILLPPLLSAITKGREYPPRLSRLISLVGVAAAGTLIVLSAANAELGRGRYPTAAADAAYANAGKNGRVFTTERYADWLLVEHPDLAARIAYDARLELMSARELSSLAALISRGDAWQRLTNGYSTLVLDQRSNRKLVLKLQHAKGIHTLYRDANTIVLSRR
jgi:hypothetical protein